MGRVATSPDSVAKHLVVGTLRHPAVAGVSFYLGAINIASWRYEMVAKAIEQGYVTVKSEAGWTNNAQYLVKENLMRVPQYTSVTIEQRALIIHEATHTICDIFRYIMSGDEWEGVAYVAQALFMRKNGITMGGPASFDPNDPVSTVGWNLILNQSGRIAELIHQKQPVPQGEIDALYLGLQNANWYRANHGKTFNLDGVDDRFLQAGH